MRFPRVVAWTVLLALAVVGATLPGDAPETPIGPRWWPSEWGPQDQRGAANRMTPDKVREAVRLIREGKVYSLGHTYEYGMPTLGKRHFSLVIPGSPTGGPDGQNRVVYHDDLFSGEIGQVGTQLDGLGHVGVRLGGDDYFYNGFRRSEFGKAYGLEKLGVEHVGVFFTRGILLDMAAYKGVARMRVGEVITPEDLEGAMKKEGVKVGEGDVVLLRTGHAQLWMKDNEAFNKGEPGIGVPAARWLCAQKITLVGSDTWATEVVPPENKDRPFEAHQVLLTRHGVYNLENMALEELARDKVYEFAFIFAPLPLKGATGSPGNPIAVR
ncbi:MAG TPA: cyclase family protein [Gemmataceae bacterium]|nr:cyclase family protein [Gemmataceae bacterium]